MFHTLGNLVARFWYLVIALWLSAMTAGWIFAPAWESVTKSGEVGFLPENSPSRRGDLLYQKAFELDYSAGNVALVFARKDGELQQRDRDFIAKEIVPGMGKIAQKQINGHDNPIGTIRTLAQEGVGALFVSPDKKATIVMVELSTAFQDQRNIPLVRMIETMLAELRSAGKIPANLEVGVTGSATAGRDLDVAEESSAHTIERWTIGIVVLLLLFLYRAPLVAIIPLVTVFVSVEVSMRILGWLAGEKIFTPARDLSVFVTVLAYGAGVDYCLFLIARYREELDTGAAPAVALTRTIARVGGAITASAATVICGIGALAFARFGKMHEAGLVIPLALTVALLGTLTFATALLRLAGPWAFWPLKPGPKLPNETPPTGLRRVLESTFMPGFWDHVGPILVRRAGLIWMATTALLIPFAGVGLYYANDQNFNPLSDLPATAPSQAGSKMMQRHFPVGVLAPVTVLIRNDQVDFGDDKGIAAIELLTDRLLHQRKSLGIIDIRCIAQPLGISPAAQEKLAAFKASKEDVQKTIREEARTYYVSRADDYAGHVTRMEVTLEHDPLNREGIASLVNIEKAIAKVLPDDLQGSTIEFAGSTASLRDLSEIKRDDQQLIQVLVSAVVLLLLLILLRRVVVSIYLVLSVLLSYFATLGLTEILFRSLATEEFIGLDWKVPIFLFTILVAVGEDYNIFLLTRVQEEQDEHGSMNAIPVALSKTGSVISSCGFVMAGTFASLLSGSLQAMKELGFALAVGVLLDTLVVRPILVPTFLVLLQRLIPGRLGRFMALGRWNEKPAMTAAKPTRTQAEPDPVPELSNQAISSME